MINELVNLANKLDDMGLSKFANRLDNIIRLSSKSDEYSPDDADELIATFQNALKPIESHDPRDLELDHYESHIDLDKGEAGEDPRFLPPEETRRYSITSHPDAERIGLRLSEILDPNHDSIVTLEEAVSGLEDILNVDLGDVSEDGWSNINWEALEDLVRSALDKRDDNEFSDVMPQKSNNEL